MENMILDTPSTNRCFFSNRYVNGVFLIIVVFAVIFLRLHLLAERSLWLDEALSIIQASYPVGDIWAYTVFQYHELFEIHLPIYFIILHFCSVFGMSEFVIRLPSVIFGLAAFPVLYLTTKRLYNSKVAKIACLILAFSWLHIRYSQEVRMYSLFLFLSLASFYFFVRSLQENRMCDWVTYIFLTAINLCTHVFSVFLPVSQVIYLALMYKKSAWKQTIMSFSVTLLAIFIFFVLILKDVYLRAFISGSTVPDPNPFFIPSILAGMSSGHPSLPLGWISIPLFLAILFKPTYKAIREVKSETILVLAHLAVPPPCLGIIFPVHTQNCHSLRNFPFAILYHSRFRSHCRDKGRVS